MESAMEIAKENEAPKKSGLAYRAIIVPQVPGNAFVVQTNSFDTAETLADCLAMFQLHLFKHGIMGDYSNAVFVEFWDEEEQDWVAADDYDA